MKMSTSRRRLMLVIIWGVLNLKSAKSLKLIGDLNKKLFGFKDCIIEITLNSTEAHLEPLPFPVQLVSQAYKFPAEYERARDHYAWKYSKISCTLQLYILIYEFQPIISLQYKQEVKLRNHILPLYTRCTDPCYLVLVQENDPLEAPPNFNDPLYAFLEYQRQASLRKLKFLWTVDVDGEDQVVNFASTETTCLSIQHIIFIGANGLIRETLPKRWLYVLSPEFGRPEMEDIVTHDRKQILWNHHHAIDYICPQPSAHPRNGKVPLKHYYKLLSDKTPGLSLQSTQEVYSFLRSLIFATNGSGDFKVFYTVNGILPRFCYGTRYHSTDLPAIMSADRYSFIPTESDGFNFITYYTESSYWSNALVFARPFQPEVWIGIASILLLTFGFLLLKQCMRPSKLSSYEIISPILGNAVEVGISRRVKRVIRADVQLSLMFGVWLVLTIVLTNAFRGKIISYLATPWTVTLDSNYFHEQVEFKYYTLMTQGLVNLLMCTPSSSVGVEPICPKNGSTASNKPCVQIPIQLSDFGDTINKSLEAELRSPSASERKSLLMKLANSTFVFPSCRFKEIVNGLINDTKVAYVSWDSQMDPLIAALRLKYPDAHLFKGKENFLSQPRFWEISNIPNTLPKFRLMQLLSSGIYNFWTYWLSERSNKEELKIKGSKKGPTALSRDSKLFFIFYVFLLGNALAMFAFLMELLCTGIRKLFNRRNTFFTSSNRVTSLL